jgi:tetratricopeptide (TPR) repeat protein
MSGARDTVLNILSGLSSNMTATYLATVLAGGAVGAAALAPCAAFGALLLGSSFLQARNGQKASKDVKERMERVEHALRKMATKQEEARQELADLVMAQDWVRDAKNDEFQKAWMAHAEAAMLALGGDVKDIQSTLDGLTTLSNDTNARVRKVQATTEATAEKAGQLLTEQQRQAAAIEKLVAQMEGMQQVEQLRSENDALKTELAAATERYVKAESARGRPWREVIEELRTDPSRLLKFLDDALENDEEEFLEKHRQRAAVAAITGEFQKATLSLEKILALRPDDLNALTRLGHVKQVLGYIDEAVEAYKRVGELATDEEGKAVALANLGLMAYERGDLGTAEKQLKQALAIDQKHGDLRAIAGDFGNLGLVEKTRENLEAAEEYFLKALAIDKHIGASEGAAIRYGNLGVVAQLRGDSKAAESFFKQSLALYESVGHQAGIASNYGNLGLLERARGDLNAATEYCQKSLQISEKLGRQIGIASQHGNLGGIAVERGNVDLARFHFQKALAINEALGRQHGIAIQYNNLGLLASRQGEFGEAQRLLTLSRDLYASIGAVTQSRDVQLKMDRLAAGGTK